MPPPQRLTDLTDLTEMGRLVERRPVRPLAAAVIERIAAGEVIERPASVVRELIENALDAQAGAIHMELREGGLRLIRVVDDGCGIPAAEVELALTNHATSKIGDVDDLAHVRTLGFRGEALASIASLSELRLCSAAEGQDHAVAVTARAGAVLAREREARSRGTTVTVRDLLADVPARRAMLRAPAGETAQVLATVRDYALSHATVRFTLLADDHLLLATPGSGPLDAVVAIYGADLARSLVELPPTPAGEAVIAGWVASRAFTQRDTRHLVLCVNGRPVANSGLAAAAQAGYRPLLRKGRHPIALLTITTDPSQVDANVHPAKRHVLLRDERPIGAALRDALHSALGTRAAPSPPPLTALASAYEHVRQPAFPLHRPRRSVHEPRPLYVPSPAALSVGASAAPAALPALAALGQLDDCLIVAQSPAGDLYLVDQHRAHERLLYEALCRQPAPTPTTATTATATPAEGDGNGEDATPLTAGQMLLEPLLVELTERQAQVLAARLVELAALGLVCEPFGGATFLVRALPMLPEGAASVASFAAALAADAAEDTDAWIEHLRASLACRAALRRGQPLAPEAQRALLADLARAEAPAVCPHGSPIVVRWAREQLARTFEW